MSFQTQDENFINKEIGGITYTISRFSPTPSVKLSTRIAKFAGPAIASAVEDFMKVKPGAKPTTADLNIAKIVLAILPNLEEDMMAQTMKDLCSCCSVKGVELKDRSYEDHFRSNMKNLIPLVKEVVGYQFSDFLSGLLTGNRQI